MQYVAQKFSNTTWPCSSFKRNGLPASVWNSTSGTGSKFVLAVATGGAVGVWSKVTMPSQFGIQAMNFDVANNVDWPLITSMPMTFSTTPEMTSTLCRCL